MGLGGKTADLQVTHSFPWSCLGTTQDTLLHLRDRPVFRHLSRTSRKQQAPALRCLPKATSLPQFRVSLSTKPVNLFFLTAQEIHPAVLQVLGECFDHHRWTLRGSSCLCGKIVWKYWLLSKEMFYPFKVGTAENDFVCCKINQVDKFI